MNSIDLAKNIDASHDSGGSAPVLDIAGILSRRKWQILIIFLLIVTCVAVVTFRMPKQYESRMKILVKNERANMVVSASNSAQSAPGEVSETEINTEIELLNNNDLLQQVVTACGLDRLDPKSGTKNQQIALEQAVSGLQRDLKISPVKKADIIEVDYTSQDPHQAVAVLRQLAASYLEAHLKVHSTPGTHKFFLSQADHYQNELKEAETKLMDFRLKNDIVLFGQQQEEILRRASESSSMLLAAEAGIREYTRRIADARSQVTAAEPRVVTQSHTLSNQNSVERLSTMLVELQNKRTQLLAKYRPDDRLVQEVSQEISDTQTALDSAKTLTGSDQTTDVNPVRQTLALEIAKEQAELAGLEARRQTLLEQTNNYRQQLNRLGHATSEYDDLIRNQKEAEDNYLLYARKTEEARIADSLDQQQIANVTIAENPVEPHLPSKPNVPMNLALGTALAGFLSLGIAFSAEYVEQARIDTGTPGSLRPAPGAQHLVETVEHPADLESLTGLPVLATTKRS